MINKKEDFANVIWTDNERTRYIIWDAYEGFIEYYNRYMMYISLGREDPVNIAALNRYANFFYEEVRTLFQSFKELNVDDVKRADYLFKNNIFLTKKELVFLRRFFADFMYASGIKNIIMQKDLRSNYDKIHQKFGLENKK